MNKDIAILSSVRSAIGKASRGALKDTRPDTLAARIINEAVRRAAISPKDIEDVVLGCAMPEAEQGMNVGRIAAILGGLPETTSASTVNRFCSSGLQAVAEIANAINANQIVMGLAGGVESMSMVPMGGHKPSANPSLMQDHPEQYTPMGITAENVAKRFNISRQDQDLFAFNSHKKAVTAIEKGLFKDEIVSVNASVFINGQEKLVPFSVDEGPRADTTLEKLASLPPVFDRLGSVTAGNSSQVSDGAAACILIDAAEAKKRSLKVMAYFRDFATVGVAADIMGTGPVPAIRKLLARNNLKISDIDVFEINEAFASQAIYCIRELGIDPERVNPCGGAIALGHPLGCTGARQIATILRQMERSGARYGVTAMCVGGGMGAASLIELA